MKRIISVAFVGVFFMSILSSCGSSKQRCDAYGNNITPTEQASDLAQR